MNTGKSLSNTAIISINEGRKIGSIKDLYLNADAREVIAVLVGKEGLLGRKPQIVERSQLAVIGVDVWLARESDAVKSLNDVPGGEDYLAMADFRGREIVTSGGTKIGSIGDVLLDDEARVRGFMLGRVHVQGTLADSKRVARDAITDLGDDENPVILDMALAEMLQLPE
ncbi:MAG: PRC-barrel domain-containing protein [Anaerolineales bacterium]